MRSPLDQRFIKTQQLMKSGQMIGTDRAIGRVSFAKQRLHAVKSKKQGVGYVRYLDTISRPEYELFNIRTIDIDRSIGQDAATCTITLWNSDEQSQQPEGIDFAGRRGYMTTGRGIPHPVTTSVYNKVDDFYGTDVTYPTSWGYPENRYRDALVPNTVLRTYQGYGSDNFDSYGNLIAEGDDGYIAPANDSKLYLTGTWLIDSVTYGADGTISIECRDMGKLLIEQYIYPPMIPIDRFPLIYCPAHKATGHKESIGKNVATFHSSSVDKRYGKNHRIHGHRGSDAFDSRADSYWLSGTNATANGVEWIQAHSKGEINELVLQTYQGNYIAYICVHEDGAWQGTHTISGTSGNGENLDQSEGNGGAGFFYHISTGDTLWDLAGTFYGNHLLWPRIAKMNQNIIKDPHWIYPGQRIKIPYIKGTKSPGPDGGSGTGGSKVQIKYVSRVTIPKSGKVTVKLPRTYKADYVRVVLTGLNHIQGSYRTGMRTFVARNHITNTYHPSTIGKAGYIQDWTEPIKEMVAWAGLTWFNSTAPADPLLSVSNTDVDLAYGNIRYHIPAGAHLRAWGDFEVLGAGPIVCTPGDYFTSKSFKEGIQQIVDFIGGVFYIDETGGAQFRLPNIWSSGNFIDDTSAASSLGARIKELPIEFHEDANLTQYSATISDESLRSEILVIGGIPGQFAKGPVAGGYVLGYNSATHTTSAIDFSDILSGQYRLMVAPGDATKLFYTETECQRMAELTALFILFTYRVGSLSAPAHPGLQLDDQVRIFERVTNEANIHYVSAIRSHQDLESGEYTMEVTTHWLGSDPDKDWFVNKAQLTPAVMELPAILKRVGKTAGGDVFEQPPYGVSS